MHVYRRIVARNRQHGGVHPSTIMKEERVEEAIMSKVWFITGAGSGIGAGIAKAALRAGDRVVATGRSLDKVRNALRDDAGGNLAFVRLDVADEAQAKAA